MNKNSGIFIGIIAIVILVVGLFTFSEQKTKKNELVENNSAKEKKITNTNDEVLVDSGVMVDVEKTALLDNNYTEPVLAEDGMKPVEQSVVLVKTGSYEEYSEEKIAMAATGDVVIFFHASWCPSCRALNMDIEKNIGEIPPGMAILKADYDKEADLKKKYGVTTQHTLVQVDKNGNVIKKWSGGSKLENLLSQVE